MLLCILLVIVMLLLGLSVFHLIRHDMDMKYLAEKGYYDPVSVGEHALNVMQFGNENFSSYRYPPMRLQRKDP